MPYSEQSNKILVTGGCGFIGSHTSVCLIEAGFEPVIIDNLSNSVEGIPERIGEITGYTPEFYETDCRNEAELLEILGSDQWFGAIHFAAFKQVGESVEEPLKYYGNNLVGMSSLMSAMKQGGIPNLVFSSSCTVYGEPGRLPVTEKESWKNAESPYGFTKQVCERMLIDDSRSTQPFFNSISLRYFNPIGAHESSLIGELPLGTPENLVPYVTQTAKGKLKELTVFGDSYPTEDGTCVRDYIHVMDLGEAHVRALEFLRGKKPGNTALNIGTGRGSSVLEIIRWFEQANDIKVPYRIGQKRKGDVAAIWADPALSEKTLKWKARRSVKDALKDAWNWEKSLES